MGLDMYLKRANMHGYSPRVVEETVSYLDYLEEKNVNPDNTDTFEDWIGFPVEVNMDAVNALQCEWKDRYFPDDREKKYPVKNVFEYVGYWRKANAIHRWFVENVQNGMDDCGTYIVEKEQLEELLSICKAVAAGTVKPQVMLPTQAGFFFGDTKYNEYYMEDVEHTIDILTQVLAETDWNTQSVCYHSSW